MAKFKGKFCKKGRDKINEALERGRESRWRQETASAANVVPIISYDHEYAACDIPDPSQQIEIPLDENLKEGEWRVGRRVVELGNNNKPKQTTFVWTIHRNISLYAMECYILFVVKINLGIFADGLKSCQLCSQPLHLNDCTGEKKFGLGLMLLIRCNYC